MEPEAHPRLVSPVMEGSMDSVGVRHDGVARLQDHGHRLPETRHLAFQVLQPELVGRDPVMDTPQLVGAGHEPDAAIVLVRRRHRHEQAADAGIGQTPVDAVLVPVLGPHLVGQLGEGEALQQLGRPVEFLDRALDCLRAHEGVERRRLGVDVLLGTVALAHQPVDIGADLRQAVRRHVAAQDDIAVAVERRRGLGIEAGARFGGNEALGFDEIVDCHGGYLIPFGRAGNRLERPSGAARRLSRRHARRG